MIPPDSRDDWADGAPRLLAEINVTPFIDVMLVLLIIFMVAAPLMMVGIPLKLPTTTAQSVSQPRKPVVVSMDKDGRVFVGDEAQSLDDLPSRLSAMVKNDPELVVYVRADKSIDYGRIMDLLGKVGSGGVARLSLVAEGQSQPGNGKP